MYVHANEINEFPVPKMKVEEINDTNAAGDAFVGGFLSQFISGKPIEDCLKCGIWASQEIIKNIGCTFHKNKFYP